MERHNKKGVVRLNDVPAAVLALVIIGIFLGIGALIVAELQDKQADVVTITLGSVNETQTFTQGTAITLNNASSFVGFSATSSTVQVIGNNSAVNSGNYTLTDTTITITNSSRDGIGSGHVNLTYGFTYDDTDAFYNATSNSLIGLDDFGSFLPIIAIVVAAAVILGVVFLIRT